MDKPQTPEEPKVFEVPSWRMDYLVERMSKLQARARRLGCSEPKITEVGVEDRPETKWTVEGGARKQVPTGKINRIHFILVEGEAPKFSGWTFVAAVDQMEEGNFVRVAPHQSLPEVYWTMKPCCEHCGVERARVNHYVVRNEAGVHKMVGSSCLKDFLGHVAPDNIALLATFWSEVDGVVSESASGGSGGVDFIDLRIFLSYVSASIYKEGWLSRGRARDDGGTATADRAISSMFPDPLAKDLSGRLLPTDEDRALAEKSIAWALSLEAKNDFEHNLNLFAKCDVLPWRGTGVAAAMVFCYKREIEKTILREKKAQMFAASQYVGEIGKRLDFEVTVVGLHQIAGNYGTTSIYKLLDAAGNLLTWFASSDALEDGKAYVLKGTVKAHEEYKGTKQTIITRCKVVKELEVAK